MAGAYRAVVAPVGRPLVNPDCRDGKHTACGGDGWDFTLDEPIGCTCQCHR
jgi:hypothetical protein